MNPEDLQKLLDAARPEDRLGIIHSYIMEKSWTTKFPSPHRDVILPRHILGLGTSSATIASHANKASTSQTIRLTVSPLSGGPYSIVGATVKGDGTLAQPIVAHLNGLAPETSYWFIVQIINDDGSIALQSEESAFTTLSHNSTVTYATDIRMTTATIRATANLGTLERAVLRYSKAGEDDYKEAYGLSAHLTRLTPGQKYVYYLQVLDANGNVLDESSERDFTTLAFVVSCDVTRIKVSSAALHGSADYVAPGDNITLLYKAHGEKQYQTAGITPGSDMLGQKAEFKLGGLKAGTRYAAKAQVTDAAGKVLYESKDTSFTTERYGLQLAALDVRAATAQLLGIARYVDPMDSLQIIYQDKTLASQQGVDAEQTLPTSLTDLTPETEYMVSLEVLSNGEVIDGTTATFKTGTHSPETVNVLNIRDRTATLLGTAVWVPRRGFARFAWGRTPGQYPSQSQLMFGDDSELQSFAQLIFGLEPVSEYFFILEVLASDGTTVTARSDELSFTTTEALRMRKARP